MNVPPHPDTTLRRDLLLLALFGALLFFPGLGMRDLWNPDEARYAEVAREMRLGGSPETFFVPHLNGEVYSQKPPLLFWLMALGQEIWPGKPETASRLPVALAAVASLLLLYRLGERLFSRRAAWIAAAAFATCTKILWQGRFGQIDMLLVALVLAAVWFWVRGFTEERPGLYPWFFVFAGLATLAKGPVGLLPPLLSILAFLAVTRQWNEMKKLRIGWGLLLWGAVVLLWLGPAAAFGGRDYVEHIVFTQNVTRYADPWHHFRPWYYYLTVLPLDFFPWSFFLPGAIVLGWKRFQGRQRQSFLFALCWVVVTIVFFSLSPAKRTVYILTMYPAMALLVAAALDEIAAHRQELRRYVTVPTALLAVLATVAALALPIAGRTRAEFAPLGGEPFVWALTAVVSLIAVGFVVAFLRARAGRGEQAAAALAAGMAAFLVAAALFVIPRFDAVKSARPMSRHLLARMKPGEPYGIFPRLDSTFLFYTERFAVELENEDAVRRFAARPQRVWILARGDDWKDITPPPGLVPVARDRDLKSGYLLYSNR